MLADSHEKRAAHELGFFGQQGPCAWWWQRTIFECKKHTEHNNFWMQKNKTHLSVLWRALFNPSRSEFCTRSQAQLLQWSALHEPACGELSRNIFAISIIYFRLTDCIMISRAYFVRVCWCKIYISSHLYTRTRSLLWARQIHPILLNPPKTKRAGRNIAVIVYISQIMSAVSPLWIACVPWWIMCVMFVTSVTNVKFLTELRFGIQFDPSSCTSYTFHTIRRSKYTAQIFTIDCLGTKIAPVEFFFLQDELWKCFDLSSLDFALKLLNSATHFPLHDSLGTLSLLSINSGSNGTGVFAVSDRKKKKKTPRGCTEIWPVGLSQKLSAKEPLQRVTSTHAKQSAKSFSPNTDPFQWSLPS